MSVVTNLILHMGLAEAEKEQLGLINQFWEDEDPELSEPGLVAVDDSKLPTGWYGGTKYLEANLAIGAFNHLNLDDFIKYLHSLQWRSPGQVQLMVSEQEDDKFRIIDVFPERSAP